jgi:RNA polymerase sigma-70 factor (ECF subfamily)
MSAAEEVNLARRLMAGDLTAFERFVEVFQQKLFQYSYLTCGQREDAEEVAQETLLKVFQNYSQLREPERIRTWVFRIAKNVCHMKRRKSIYAPKTELSLDEMRSPPGEGSRLEIPDWSRIPETQAMSAQVRTRLNEAIRELPDIYRNTLLLRDVEGLSTDEAAEVLEVTADVVKTRLHRARQAVRRALSKRLPAADAAEFRSRSKIQVEELPGPLPDRVKGEMLAAFGRPA